MELQTHGLFGDRDTIDEAVEYFDTVIKAMPKEEQLPMLTAFYVLWNTIANNYTLNQKGKSNETTD